MMNDKVFYLMVFVIVALIITVIILYGLYKKSGSSKKETKDDTESVPKRYRTVKGRYVASRTYKVVCSIKLKENVNFRNSEIIPEKTIGIVVPVKISIDDIAKFKRCGVLYEVLANIAKESYYFVLERDRTINSYRTWNEKDPCVDYEFYIDEDILTKDNYSICEYLEEMKDDNDVGF